MFFVGKCVAGTISPPRLHISFSWAVISVTASIASLLHRARMPWIVEHPCDPWLLDVPKIQTLAAQPHMAWALADFCCPLDLPCRKRTLFPISNVDSKDLASYNTKVCWDRGTLQFDVHPNSLDHARPPRLSFAIAMVLTMKARRLQRTHLFRAVGDSSLDASKDIDMGVDD